MDKDELTPEEALKNKLIYIGAAFVAFSFFLLFLILLTPKEVFLVIAGEYKIVKVERTK